MKKIILACTVALAMAGSAEAQTYTLEQCKEQALKNNRTLQSKRIDVENAQHDRKSARMNYFPKVSANAMGFLTLNDLVDGKMELSDEAKQSMAQNQMLGGLIQQQPAQMQQQLMMALSQLKDINFSFLDKGFTAAITAIQPLYAGGQIINGNKLAKVGVEVKELQYEMSEKDVIQNVTQYYWTIQNLRGNLKTLDAVDDQLAQVHKQVEQYVKAGVTNRNDLLKVELKQQEMASTRLKVNNGLELAQMALGQLVGADINTFRAAEEQTDNILSPLSYYTDVKTAVGQRSEMKLTEKAVEASRLKVKMERGKSLPTVAVGAVGMYYTMAGDVTSSTNLGSEMKSGTMKLNNTNLMGVATVSVPISSWWSHSHDVKKAKANVVQAQLTRQETEEKLQLDVQSAWNNLQESYAQVEIAKKSLESSAENLRLNRDYYNVGQTTMSELMDAVTQYTKSANALTEAQANYQVKVADYQRKSR